MDNGANISSKFGVSTYGCRNSKSRHYVYMHTIFIVAQIFSTHVHEKSTSYHCAYMYIHTILIVAWIFSVYVSRNSDICTDLLILEFLQTYPKQLCVFIRNLCIYTLPYNYPTQFVVSETRNHTLVWAGHWSFLPMTISAHNLYVPEL